VIGASPDRGLLAGLRASQGRLFAFLLLAAFASASLPGLNNFPGEVLIFFAAFKVSPWLAFFAGLGAVLGAAVMVRAFHQVFLGEARIQQPGVEAAPDLNRVETGVALGMASLWVVLGIYPMLLLGPVEKAVAFIHAMGWAG
jgi:NADH-quinone oxidoreductase subunit M